MQTTPKEQLLRKINADANLLARFRHGTATVTDHVTVTTWLGAQTRDFYAGYEQALRAAANGIARRIA